MMYASSVISFELDSVILYVTQTSSIRAMKFYFEARFKKLVKIYSLEKNLLTTLSGTSILLSSELLDI
jgi:hypothetical protein